jgi:hypothetical protein
MQPEEQPEAPSGPWRAASTFTMGAVGLLCKGFLSGLSTVETHGMDDFLKLIDEREDVAGRERGLLTGMRMRLSSLCNIFIILTVTSIESHLCVRTFAMVGVLAIGGTALTCC